MQLKMGQHIIGISPPIWVWADQARLAGLWCIGATTYNLDPHDYMRMGTKVTAGRAPVSVATKEDEL